MKLLCFRMLPAILLLTSAQLFNGCVTNVYPAENTDSIAQRTEDLAPELGNPAYIGITASLRLKSLTGDPSLIVNLRHKNTGKKLKINAEAKPSLVTKDGFIPLLFVVPHGSYTLETVEFYMPGGEVDGQRYKGTSTTIPLSNKFSGFQVEEGSFIHLLKIGAASSQSKDMAGDSLQHSIQTIHTFERPAPETWERFKGFLLAKSSYFLTRTPMDQLERLKLDWSKNPDRRAPASDGLGFERPFAGRRAESVNKTLEGLNSKARECQRAHAPQKKGRVTYTYIISPDGAVADAKVTENRIAGLSFSDCILAALKTLKFGPAPDDNYSSWSGYLEF